MKLVEVVYISRSLNSSSLKDEGEKNQLYKPRSLAHQTLINSASGATWFHAFLSRSNWSFEKYGEASSNIGISVTWGPMMHRQESMGGSSIEASAFGYARHVDGGRGGGGLEGNKKRRAMKAALLRGRTFVCVKESGRYLT